MKKTLLTVALSAAASFAAAADYELDAAHTNARFAIDHFGTSTNVGGFFGLEGKMTFDAAKQNGKIDLVIPVAKLQTGSEHFTGHLKSADLFDAEKFPEMRFVSDKFHFKNGKVSRVDGKLTLLGQTRPVSLKAKKFNCYQSPMLKTEVCGGDFTAKIDRTQWGMNYLTDVGMSKKVRLDIQVEAAKK
ncbi:MAG: YceI family protein [Neisseria sp.]|nr:YceI family protein [Neisseria sp.]